MIPTLRDMSSGFTPIHPVHPGVDEGNVFRYHPPALSVYPSGWGGGGNRDPTEPGNRPPMLNHRPMFLIHICMSNGSLSDGLSRSAGGPARPKSQQADLMAPWSKSERRCRQSHVDAKARQGIEYVAREFPQHLKYQLTNQAASMNGVQGDTLPREIHIIVRVMARTLALSPRRMRGVQDMDDARRLRSF